MILVDPNLEPDLDPNAAPAGARKQRLAASPRKHPVLSVRALTGFLRKAQHAVRLRGQVSVLLTSDAAIRDLNRRFRGKNKATDVLSFPAEAMGRERIAGDLAISVPTAQRQGTACGHSLQTELKVLILHGLLHLAGYDHETDHGEMARREQRLRAELGLPPGLIERAAKPSGKAMADPSAAAPKAASAPAVKRAGKAPRPRSGKP